jgi:itaconate CoA-transferase
MTSRPLDGTTVVALEQAVAAPFATRQLADLGARVIKIERPDGGDFARNYDGVVKGLSSNFVWLNRSKESLTLDLKRSEAKDVLTQLIRTADVFVQNLAPGAAGRLGLDAQVLRDIDSRLIVCGLSGYGTSGPYREKKAYDLLIQAESGVVSITGTAEEPVKVSVAIADIAAGMYAYSSIMTALYSRERTGEGASIEVSMLEALGEWMGFPLYYTMYGGMQPQRSGSRHATIAPYGPFSGSDQEVVFLGLQNEREWVRFCTKVLEQPDLVSDSRFDTNLKRVDNRVELEQKIQAVFSRFPVAAIIERLDGAQIANAKLNSVEQFAAHPQLAARNRWREVDSSVGPVRAMIPPVDIEGVEARMDRIPELGENTDQILKELGYDSGTVAQWRASGVV